jgi:hypothetical protein
MSSKAVEREHPVAIWIINSSRADDKPSLWGDPVGRVPLSNGTAGHGVGKFEVQKRFGSGDRMIL